jgi:restriction system protein
MSNNDLFDFEKHANSFKLEKILMPIIVKIMQDNGGSISRTDIDEQVSDYDERFDKEKVVYYDKKTSKGSYRPWLFTRNFSIKNLEQAGLLEIPQRNEIVLTQKGIDCDASKINVEQDITRISDKYWSKKAQERKNRNRPADDDQDGYTIGDNIDLLQNNWRSAVKKKIDKMDGKKFEVFSRGLLKQMNIKIDPNKGVNYTADGGIDGYGYYVGDDFRTIRVAIQCKRWSGSIGAPEIDKLRGATAKFGAEYGIFITNSHFSTDAKKAAITGNMPITLIDGDSLMKLIEKYEYNLIPVKTYELGEFYNDIGDESNNSEEDK